MLKNGNQFPLIYDVNGKQYRLLKLTDRSFQKINERWATMTAEGRTETVTDRFFVIAESLHMTLDDAQKLFTADAINTAIQTLASMKPRTLTEQPTSLTPPVKSE